MKNKYEIHGDKTIIHLIKRHKANILIAEIDTEDLDIVSAFPNTWYSFLSQTGKIHYAAGKITINGKEKFISMHRLIMNAPTEFNVDHKDRNGLNNRRENLRLATIAENAQNRPFIRNNKTGERGIWKTKNNKFFANVVVNGKRVYGKTFETIDDAILAVRTARANLMPFSPEALLKNKGVHDNEL